MTIKEVISSVINITSFKYEIYFEESPYIPQRILNPTEINEWLIKPDALSRLNIHLNNKYLFSIYNEWIDLDSEIIIKEYEHYGQDVLYKEFLNYCLTLRRYNKINDFLTDAS